MVSTAVAFTDMLPSPRVQLDIDPTDLDSAAVSVTVWQTSPWGQEKVNRTRRLVAGGAVIDDFEVPGGVPVVYRVEQFDASGATLGFALNLPVQVSWDPGDVILSDPLDPGNAVRVRAEKLFAGSLERGRSSSLYRAGSKTFVMAGPMSGFQKVSLRVVTENDADRTMLGLITEQATMLVRAMPQTRLPGVLYVSVPTVPMVPFNARTGGDVDVWDMAGDEVSRPEIDIVVAVYSYDLFKAYLDAKYPPEATYDDAATEWATYVDAARTRPSPV
ncbi:hypothetical protein [Microbacterium sp. PAMC21962]|uniref:hypothetical protein n=1 Tax=Microbacterium sp. PAMC21962 TaxID=2861280 RepID=UPI001C62A08A|nr:hypothetical protein [Microbacterium sp. PAMC21962]QYF98446.1 hypothetical protein KY498_04165 [Microbacterium sp. PAMC21962]